MFLQALTSRNRTRDFEEREGKKAKEKYMWGQNGPYTLSNRCQPFTRGHAMINLLLTFIITTIILWHTYKYPQVIVEVIIPLYNFPLIIYYFLSACILVNLNVERANWASTPDSTLVLGFRYLRPIQDRSTLNHFQCLFYPIKIRIIGPKCPTELNCED